MMVLVTYDVSTVTASGRKRLSKIAKICRDYGQRVQNSVFECNLSNAEFIGVKEKLIKAIDEKEDSLRIYHLGNNYSHHIEHYGVKESYDPDGEIIL